jgi:hypothetical protein
MSRERERRTGPETKQTETNKNFGSGNIARDVGCKSNGKNRV